MQAMTDIEQQERKEAEAEYPERGSEDFHTLEQWHRYHEWSVGARSGYAAALISERSKLLTPELPPRPPNGIGEDPPRYGLKWNGPNQPLSVPMEDGYWTPYHIAQAHIDALIDVLKAERSKPSLMVGFSEEEVRLIADGVAEDCGVDDETEDGAYTWKCMLECAMKVHEAHAANTRAVSIDKIMDEVMGWCCATKDAEEDLRERLMKIMP